MLSRHTWIMVAQHFEIITKAYETSYKKENLKELKMFALKNMIVRPSSVLVLLLLKRGLSLVRKPLYLLCGT